ncbi:MAG: sugar ABC transporter permease, partial [Chloroflexi bacterium]|nr:sugar ABC transporter permease [Chloroflexota bacterium]
MTTLATVGSDRAGARRRVSIAERALGVVPFYYWAVLPALVATLAVVVFPLFYSFGLSFYHYVLTDPRNIHFDGLTNYAHAFSDPTFRNSIGTTLIYGLGTVTAELLLGMVFAITVNSLTFGQG